MKIDYGKGLREMEIIEYAIANSSLLSKSDIIIKGTGRLILKNIISITSWLAKQDAKDFCCSWMSIKMVHSDSRFFFCSLSFLKKFVSYKNRLNYKLNFEKTLATCIGENKKNFRFIYPPLWYNIEGIGGGFGAIYHYTRIQYYRQNLKNIIYYIAYNWYNYWPSNTIHQ